MVEGSKWFEYIQDPFCLKQLPTMMATTTTTTMISTMATTTTKGGSRQTIKNAGIIAAGFHGERRMPKT